MRKNKTENNFIFLKGKIKILSKLIFSIKLLEVKQRDILTL